MNRAKFGWMKVSCRPAVWGMSVWEFYFPRLLRDGWRLLAREDRTPADAAWPTGARIFEKAFAEGWSLRKIVNAGVARGPGKGCYWDEHELVHHRREMVVSLRNWEWAEVDGSRLVWAEKGVLRAGTVNSSGLSDPKVLIDLNPMKFEPLAAPY